MNTLIHIGYHKTGTTWLQQGIFADEAAGFTRVWPLELIEDTFVLADPFKFDPASARAAVEPFGARAQSNGTTLVVSHERLSGDPLRGGADSRLIAERLAETFPDGRVLIGIREQRSMMLSLYRQVTGVGANTESLEDFLRYRTTRREFPSVLGVLEYHPLIAYYRKLFGEDRVLVLPFELLKDPVDFAGRIAAFTGREPSAKVARGAENVGLSAGTLVVVRVLNIFLRNLGITTRLQGPRRNERLVQGRVRIERYLDRLMPRSVSRRVETQWRAAVDASFGDRFAEANRVTSDLIGIDLGSLGYVL